jgi:hypothetical protein
MAVRAGAITLATLFLATGAAPDDAFEDLGTTLFDCKDVEVKHVHLSDSELYRIELSKMHKSRKRPPIITFDANNETLTVDGKR